MSKLHLKLPGKMETKCGRKLDNHVTGTLYRNGEYTIRAEERKMDLVGIDCSHCRWGRRP